MAGSVGLCGRWCGVVWAGVGGLRQVVQAMRAVLLCDGRGCRPPGCLGLLRGRACAAASVINAECQRAGHEYDCVV